MGLEGNQRQPPSAPIGPRGVPTERVQVPAPEATIPGNAPTPAPIAAPRVAAPVRHKRVVLLGLGGGGTKVVRELNRRQPGDWLERICLDTDVSELDYADGILYLPVGKEFTQGQGAGGNPSVGQHATGANVTELRELVRGAELLLVTACLGGGTGSGGIQILADLAREEKVMSCFLLTTPLAVEGNTRRLVAEQALTLLRSRQELVAVVRNDLVFAHFPPDTPAVDAFAAANTVLSEVLLGIAELIYSQRLLPLDFAGLRTVLRPKDAYCALAVGRASGADKQTRVVDAVLASPMLGGLETLHQASAVVGILVGGPALTLGQMQGCLEALQARLSPDTRAVFGASTVAGMGDELRLTLLAVEYTSRTRRRAGRTRQFAGLNDSPREPQGREPATSEPAPAEKVKRGRGKPAERDAAQLELPFTSASTASLPMPRRHCGAMKISMSPPFSGAASAWPIRRTISSEAPTTG
jgi:cell division protein FtsZ